MTSFCASGEFPKLILNSDCEQIKTEMYRPTKSRILHDPECEAHCCTKNFGQSIQRNNFNDVEQNCYVKKSCSDDNHLPNSCADQFLYNVITSKQQVPVYQEVTSHEIVDNLGISYSKLCYDQLQEGKPYTYCSTNTSELRRRNLRNDCKSVLKRKRKRTVFTTEQIVELEGVFRKRPYVSRDERLFLTHKLNISEKAIKVWFQNRRRVTEKREKDQSDSWHSDSTVEEGCTDYTSRLDYIESQIKQNTDEYGFVTLDNKAMNELVKLIDKVLSHSTDCQSTLYDNKKIEGENASYVMYEPISPETVSEDSREIEDISNWEPSIPEESLQRLIDIQTVLFS